MSLHASVEVPEILSIILNWNQPLATSRCIEVLREAGLQMHHIIVVDNGSTDESVQVLSSKFKNIRIISNGSNLGFAKGCNIGIRKALERKPKFIWLLNNDTLPGFDSLSNMLAFAQENPRVGIIGSQLRNTNTPHDLQAWGGGWINPILGRSRLGVNSAFLGKKWAFISGASMLIRAEIFANIGLFDENFFFYWEDSDFCLRAKQAGWAMGVAEKAIVLHQGAGSLGAANPKTAELFSTGSAIFFSKHFSLPLWPVMIGLLSRTLRMVIHGEFTSITASISGTLIGLKNIKNNHSDCIHHD